MNTPYNEIFNNKNYFDEIWNSGFEINFNDLPQYNKWSDYIIGLVDWFRFNRSSEELEREFEKETYIPQFQYALANEKLKDIFKLSQIPYNLNKICCTRKGTFKILPFTDALIADALIVMRYLKKFISDELCIVDIGAGNGNTILSVALSGWFTNFDFYAIDHMPTSLKLINLFSARNGCVINTDYCDLLAKPISKSIPEGAVLYTNYVLHELTDHPDDIIERISDLKPSLVMNFEPFLTFYDHHTIYGQMCEKYLDINKYNKTFDKELRKKNGKSIDILYEEGNIFGKNPYLAKSLIVWKPRLS